MPFILSSELCSRKKSLYRKTWYLNNPFLSLYFLKSYRFFFPKILIFHVIHTYFVLDQSGRSDCLAASLKKIHLDSWLGQIVVYCNQRISFSYGVHEERHELHAIAINCFTHIGDLVPYVFEVEKIFQRHLFDYIKRFLSLRPFSNGSPLMIVMLCRPLHVVYTYSLAASILACSIVSLSFSEWPLTKTHGKSQGQLLSGPPKHSHEQSVPVWLRISRYVMTQDTISLEQRLAVTSLVMLSLHRQIVHVHVVV